MEAAALQLHRADSLPVCLGLVLGYSRYTTGKLEDKAAKLLTLGNAECLADLGCQ